MSESWTEVAPTPCRHGTFLSNKENVYCLMSLGHQMAGLGVLHGLMKVYPLLISTIHMLKLRRSLNWAGRLAHLKAEYFLLYYTPGHLVSVMMLISVIERSSSSNGCGKLSSKKTKTIKSDHHSFVSMILMTNIVLVFILAQHSDSGGWDQDGFRIQKWNIIALPHGDTITCQDEELLYGTKVV
ncbi:hypothetical protein DFJ58DRAFT_843479 [Suillus subalutaceus]|uniref:uncharacterized protein n=1 Tax=Suillus subalutaceus TaxID=48586 RepID=UPI001B8757EC|nr:uncharacterized protein DFJ58DRAFT_843479 [Suillus subalutaceus]KAG1846400.1 hypothetical protein DFJ58DRAFT_843479 [Suillus subalutaceus]